MQNQISPIVTHLNLSVDCGLRDGLITAACYGDDVQAEYQCVRTRVSLSDLNYYSRVRVSGDDALDLLNHVVLADLRRLPINQAQTTILLKDDASPSAEAYVLNLGDHFLLLTEGVAPNELLARLASLVEEKFHGAEVQDVSSSLGMLGIDGPFSWELLKFIVGIGIIGMRYLEVQPDQTLNGIPFSMCRAGKTGEYGYFILTGAEHITALWDQLLNVGARFDIRPLGYQTLDICKLENRFCNIHKEGAYVDNVLALNTRVMVSADKDDYAGAARIKKLLEAETPARVIGITFSDDVRADHSGLQLGDPVYCGAERVGQLCSLGYSHTLGRLIGLALVESAFAYVGLEYTAGGHTVRTVSAPFIFNRSLQIRPQEDSYFA